MGQAYTIIRLGGRVPASVFDKLLLVEPDLAAGLRYMQRRKEMGLSPLSLGKDMSWGEYPTLEKLCRNLGVAYTRTTEAGDDVTPEEAWWFPGMVCAETVYQGSAGETTIDSDEVHKALDSLRKGDTKPAEEYLAFLLKPHEDLPPFELWEDRKA